MAYESGFTSLDGCPCEPVTTNYVLIVVQSFLFAMLITCVFAMVIYGPIHKVQLSEGILLLVAFTGIVGWWVRSEYLERKEVFGTYNHKLDVYNRRRDMIINNGGRIKSENELYYELFN